MYDLEKDSNTHGDFFFTFHGTRRGDTGVTVPVSYINEASMVMSLGIIASLSGEINGAEFLNAFKTKEDLIAGNELHHRRTGSRYRTNIAELWITGEVPRTLYKDVFNTNQGDVRFAFDTEEEHFTIGHRPRRSVDFTDKLFLDHEMIPLFAKAMTKPDSEVSEEYFLPARAIANTIKELWKPENKKV